MCSVSNGGSGKYGTVRVLSVGSSFLLTACGGLVSFGVLPIEAFECLSQVNPGYFKGVPLSD